MPGDRTTTTTANPSGFKRPPQIYYAEFPANWTYDNGCDDDIADAVSDACHEAYNRSSQTGCCAKIGGDFCEQLIVSCELDACVMANGSFDVIEEAVEDFYDREVWAICAIPDGLSFCHSAHGLVAFRCILMLPRFFKSFWTVFDFELEMKVNSECHHFAVF